MNTIPVSPEQHRKAAEKLLHGKLIIGEKTLTTGKGGCITTSMQPRARSRPRCRWPIRARWMTR